MTVPGPIKYARSGDVSIAYQEWGGGPVTLIAVPPLAQNIEIAWQNPYLKYYFERLGSFARCIHFDKRGTGASDRTAEVPNLDMRVDDLRAVMDDAGIDEAFLAGVSEGGPLAILYTTTYPERVRGLILDNTTASLVPRFETEEAEQAHRYFREELIRRWGTSETLTLELFAPSVSDDAWYREWEPYYERQSASPAAIRELVEMNLQIDVTEIAPSVEVPTLSRNRHDDLVAPFDVARETLSRIPGIEMFERAGRDHFPHIGSDVDEWLEVYERFVTGIPPRPTNRRYLDWQTGASTVRVVTLGRFAVVVGGRDVEASEWGSRRARQLLKRLACAGGAPVPREQLIDMLWPDADDMERLSARLSVQLSMVRRVLGGGVVADRASVRLDTAQVGLDIVDLLEAARADASDRVLEVYAGEFLPEDVYEDWTTAPRDEARAAFVAAAIRLATAAAQSGDLEQAAELSRRVLAADAYDEDAHGCLVRALADLGRYGEARAAYRSYAARMTELGVRALPISEFSDTLR